jgi:hypothetical protein
VPAPIILFAYNRPRYLAEVLTALAGNPLARNSDLTVISDGPRSPADVADVGAVRTLAERARGFRTVLLIRRPVNYGLFRSVTEGLNDVSQKHTRFIILEDDLVVSKDFLSYMNDGLDRFAENARVGSIHGYVYPVDGLPDYFFLKGADCWGWATWSDRWALLSTSPRRLLRQLASERRLEEFDETGGNRYLNMLVTRALGRNQSWAILWHASLFMQNRLTLYPGQSFVKNIGHEGSGTHGESTSSYHVAPRDVYDGIQVGPIEADPAASRKISAYLRATSAHSGPRQWLERLYTAFQLRRLT